MKRVSLAMLAAVFLAATAASTAMAAAYVEVTLAPMSRSHRPPPLGKRQGWLTISNRDWRSYTVVVTGKDKIYIYRDNAPRRGGVTVPSGTSVTLALEKDTYDIYGSHSDKMRVRIREGRTATLSLEPFGRKGRSGLRGVISDGGRSHNSILFDAYVERPGPSHQRPGHSGKPTPPPPPSVIVRPPVAHKPPPTPPGKPGGHKPPPPQQGKPGKPGKPDKNDRWDNVYRR